MIYNLFYNQYSYYYYYYYKFYNSILVQIDLF